MPTVADLQRASPRSLRLYFERDGLRAGPFLEILDPERALTLPEGVVPASRRPRAPPPLRDLAARARLTLRRGTIADPFVRRWLKSHTFGGTPEYLELVLEDPRGVEVSRWRLRDAKILEIADRQRRDVGDSAFEYILLEGVIEPIEARA